MRHRVKGTIFRKKTGPRRSFTRLLAVNLIRRGKMDTTEIRAKAVRPIVERAVTMAKKGTLASRRLLIARLHDTNAVHKLIDELAPRYKERAGGYLRVIKLGKNRKRDNAATARIEFV